METNLSTPIEQEEIQTKPQPASRAWAKWLTPALLIAIIILGAVFRLTGVNWDDHTHLHPDERFLTMVESAISLPGFKDSGGTPPPAVCREWGAIFDLQCSPLFVNATPATPPPATGCAEWGGYFDTRCSPLNPYNHDFGLFVYGTFPIFLTRFVGNLIGQTGYDEIHLVGRVLSALFDLSTVLLIFLIGRRLYGVRAGLLAAFFLACAVLPIQQAHFFTVDAFETVPVLIAFWFALDIADGKSWVAFVFAGIAFGLAVASRINMAFFAAVLIAAAALRAYRQAVASRDAASRDSASRDAARPRALDDGPEPLPEPRQTMDRTFGPVEISAAWREPVARAPRFASFHDAITRTATRALVGLAAAAIVALVLFRIFQPYAANGPNFISPHIPQVDLSRGGLNLAFDVVLSWAGGVNQKFADNMQWVRDSTDGKIDAPPGIQWANRTPYIFPFDNMVQWGLGLPLGLAAWAGFLLALYQLLRYRKWEHLLIVIWVGFMFGYTGLQFVKTMRYFLPIYPFLALLAGWFLIQLWDAVADRRPAAAIAGDATQTLPTNVAPPVVPLPSGGLRSVVGGLLPRVAVAIIAAIVIGYTLFYATAYTTIYTRDYTRVAASRWIFKNIPPNSVIANEHWDDPLPVRVDGIDPYGGVYRGLPSSSDGEMHWYDEDTPEKRTQAIQWLDEAQYVVLSSNRLYGSIPRLPMRYPMTTKYYQWLFDGTLGFEKIAEFTSRPQLFGITINDDNAEEAFTVYDHPKVMIFKKTPQYSHANAEALFNSVDLSEVYRFTPPVATQSPTALLLTPSDWSLDLTGGTWSQIFNPNDWINQIPVVVWLALVEILGWLAFPLAFLVFRALNDRGYVFAKAFGLLLPAWGAWTLGSYHLLPFSRMSIAFIILCIVMLSAVAIRLRYRDLVAFVRERWRVVLVEEALFLAFFGLDLAIRYGNPDLWHQWFGGEKPMDFAYLNAVIKTTWFPPYDPWFAGGYINYYYFGQLITATLTRLSGVVPEVAYNLALPTYFALLALGAFSVVWNLIAPRVPLFAGKERNEGNKGILFPVLFSVLGALFVAVIGNLGELMLIGQTLMKMGGWTEGQGISEMFAGLGAGLQHLLIDHQPLPVSPGSWYWNATRVIPDTINEFPFFTFLYADLHAHLMALPFTLVVLGLAVNFVVRERDDDAHLAFWPYWQISPMDVIEVVGASLVIGALRAINYADYVTYPLIVACALAIGEYARRRRINLDGIIAFAWRLIAILVLSTLFYWPFVTHFATTSTSIGLWDGKRTALGEYLTVWGIFLFVVATFLIVEVLTTPAVRQAWRYIRAGLKHSSRWARFSTLYQTLATPPSAFADLVMVIIGFSALLEVGFILIQWFVFALVFPFLVMAGLLVIRPSLGPARRFIALLIAAGLALTLAVELVHYKDDIGRMNTVFKFYLQVWVMFAVAAAAGLAYVVRRARYAPQSVRLPSAWWFVFGVLLFAGFLYPLFATRAKVNDRFVADSPSGLNGMDYMKQATYEDFNTPMPLEYDREAIQWLRENIPGSPVILEANGPLYHWTSRVSINTGLPTVIGWDWHQKQQRSIIDGTIIDNRIGNVAAIYNTLDSAAALQLLKRYHVSLIYIGDMERAEYNQNGIAKFARMASAGTLELIYQNDHVQIYRITG